MDSGVGILDDRDAAVRAQTEKAFFFHVLEWHEDVFVGKGEFL